MDRNRPRGREKNVTGGSSHVGKTGSGLGTGRVGNGSSNSHGSFGSRPSYSSNRSRGTRAGGFSFGGIAVIVIILIIKSFLGGGSSGSSVSNTINTLGSLGGLLTNSGYEESLSDYETASAVYSEQDADLSVANGSRSKRTVIKGDGSDVVTIMVYMCGTDLESKGGMATKDLQEMLKASVDNNINLIVYTGGCKSWNNNIVSSSKNQIYQIKGGKLYCLEENAGNAAMVEPSTLTTFIKYCKKNFPANRNDLIFWDHGGGSISGYGYDEKNQGAGSMTLVGIDQALNNAGVYFDFIGFDACLMGTIENALLLEKYADYLIASEESEPGIGWYYTNWLNKLSQDTGMSTVLIGKNIVDDFVTTCAKECRGQKTTLSVVDLAELKATVPAELTDFSRATADLISSNNYKKVSKARKNSREFAESSKIDQIDLIHFCENMGTKEGSDLAEAVRGAVKYNRTSSNMANSNGLSIYFPYQKTGKVNTAVNLFKKIGMDSEYTKCIKEFASTEVVGQVSGGTTTSAFPSLSGTLFGGSSSSSGGSSDVLMQMLGSVLSGSTSSSSYGLDSSILSILGGKLAGNKDRVNYVADNYFNPENLAWQKDNRSYKINMDEDQWDLVESIVLNVFVDDGEGYIDLGFDNVYDFDDNGALIGDYDDTWLSINGQIVPYYYMSTTEYSDSDKYSITGYVPCLLNGERVELILVFDSANPKGYIAGAKYVYKKGESDTVAKNMTEIKEGDVIQAICDYYTYDGEYHDSYLMDTKITLKAKNQISNVRIEGGDTRATYKFTDIYNKEYWTEVLP